MAELSIYSRKHHQQIHSLDAWRRWGAPQRDYQWQDGYNAKECARAWFRSGAPGVPAELVTLCKQHPLTDATV